MNSAQDAAAYSRFRRCPAAVGKGAQREPLAETFFQLVIIEVERERLRRREGHNHRRTISSRFGRRRDSLGCISRRPDDRRLARLRAVRRRTALAQSSRAEFLRATQQVHGFAKSPALGSNLKNAASGPFGGNGNASLEVGASRSLRGHLVC